MSKNIYRVSYSTLRHIVKDNVGAIETYLKDNIPNFYMQRGSDKHAEFEKEIISTGCLPKVFGGDKIKGNFKTELKLEAIVAEFPKDIIVFSGIIDLLLEDEGVFIDFKYTTQSAASHLSTPQLGCYGLLLSCHDYKIKLGSIMTLNPDTEDVESAYVVASNKFLRSHKDFVIDKSLAFLEILEQEMKSGNTSVADKIKADTLDFYGKYVSDEGELADIPRL